MFILNRKQDQRYTILQGKYSPLKERMSTLFYLFLYLLSFSPLTGSGYHFSFVKGLKLLHVDFRQHMVSANNAHEKPVVSEEILSQILSNIGSLYILNSELLKELETRMSNWWVCMYLSITIKCFYYFSHNLDIFNYCICNVHKV